jgi:D-3-phosphoglycerate dehydrogenase
MPTVAVTDATFATFEIEAEILRQVGAELVTGQCKSVEALIPMVREADAVLTQFAPITAEVIQAMQRARVIVRYGIGVDNVDLDAARAQGIPVCNVPDYCIDEVADQTLAFILAATRQIFPNCLHIRAGNWGLATPLDRMRTLRDQTVGIVGFGRIGRAVAARLAPFKCRQLVVDPGVDAEQIRASGCAPVPLETLLAESDVVTLHCPSTPQTRRLLNAGTFARLKPGAIIVNLARGDLIETPALVAALESGRVSAAAVDVCDPEPIPLDSPLRCLPQVISAAHIASASVKAVRRLRETAAQIAVCALRGEALPNVVNGVMPQ